MRRTRIGYVASMRVVLVLAGLGCPAPPDSAGLPDTENAIDPNAPVVESAGVTRFLNETGEQYIQWTAAATVSDKQGTSTIQTFGRIDMSDAGGEIGTTDLLCQEGMCSGSWRDDAFDLECETIAVTTYDFAFVVLDTDGHESAPRVVHAEKVGEP